MSKKNKIIIAILATLVIMGINVMSVFGMTEPNDGVRFEGQIMLITLVVASLVGVLFGSLINKLIIWLSQLGQEEKQSVSFLTSWYATSISQLPFAIFNIFLVTVLSLYNAGNVVAVIVSGILNAVIYVLVLRTEKIITQRTQIIYIVIMVVFTVATNTIPLFIK